MITSILLSIPLFFIEGLLTLIPDSSGLPAGVTSAIGTAWTYVWSFNYVLPVGTMLTLITLVFGVEAGILVWKFINWVIRKIPGMS